MISFVKTSPNTFDFGRAGVFGFVPIHIGPERNTALLQRGHERQQQQQQPPLNGTRYCYETRSTSVEQACLVLCRYWARRNHGFETTANNTATTTTTLLLRQGVSPAARTTASASTTSTRSERPSAGFSAMEASASSRCCSAAICWPWSEGEETHVTLPTR